MNGDRQEIYLLVYIGGVEHQQVYETFSRSQENVVSNLLVHFNAFQVSSVKKVSLCPSNCSVYQGDSPLNATTLSVLRVLCGRSSARSETLKRLQNVISK